VEYLDVYDEEFRVHVELDGRLGHDRAGESWRDMRRDNRSEVAQMRHLRYGYVDVFGSGCAVMVEEALVYRQQGWVGPFRTCRRCSSRRPAGL
jgi:hypothetical protein